MSRTSGAHAPEIDTCPRPRRKAAAESWINLHISQVFDRKKYAEYASQDQAAIPGASLELCDGGEQRTRSGKSCRPGLASIDGLHVSIDGLHVSIDGSPCEASTVFMASGDRLYEGVHTLRKVSCVA
jgi:hypothetical protein